MNFQLGFLFRNNLSCLPNRPEFTSNKEFLPNSSIKFLHRMNQLETFWSNDLMVPANVTRVAIVKL